MGDSVATAELITVPSVVTGTTVGANIANGIYAGETYAQPTAWYVLTVPEITHLRIKLQGFAGFRPYVDALYVMDEATPPTSWEDLDWYWESYWYSEVGGAQTSARAPFGPGTYYLAVYDAEFTAGTGAFELDLSFVPIQPDDLNSESSRTINDPAETVFATQVADEGEATYIRVSRADFPHLPVDFSVRKQSVGSAPNDMLADRYVYTNPISMCPPSYIDPANNYWSNKYAGSDPGEPAHAGFPARRSLFFEWNPTSDATYDIWVESTEDDFVLAVYGMASSLDDLDAPIAEDDDSGVGNQPFVTVAGTGAPMLIVVDSKGGGGDFVLRSRLNAVSRPPNDDFANATPLGGTSGSISTDMGGASFQCGTPIFYVPYYPIGSGYYPLQPLGGDVWYGFVPTGSDYTLTWSSPNDVRITVYTGTSLTNLLPYTGFTPSGMIDNTSSGTDTFGVTPGTQYWVRVEQLDSEQSDVDFEWDTPTPEGGDNVGNAPPIVITPGGGGGTGSYDYDLAGAGQQPNEPLDAPGETIRSVWRKFTAEHDGTLWMRYDTDSFSQQPVGERLDVWRGATLGTLDLLPLDSAFRNRGAFNAGFKQWFGVRVKKDEEYLIRHSSPSIVSPSAGTMEIDVEYEMDEVWTHADGDYETVTGLPDFEDPWPVGGGVIQISEPNTYVTAKPWVGDASCKQTWVSFDLRLLSEFSATAADGPVLGRGGGPVSYYPSPGDRIGVCRLHKVQADGYGSTVREFSVHGDRNGNSWLEVWNGLGGGSAIQAYLIESFAIPNDEAEGGEWIPIDITPRGVYVHGRLVSTTDYTSNCTKVDFGCFRFPNQESTWGPYGPAPAAQVYGPPETWTVQLQSLRITDRVVDGPRLFVNELEAGDTPQNMIVDFDTRIGGLDGATSVAYPELPYFLSGSNASVDPALHQVDNPGTRSWDCLRIHDQHRFWRVQHTDSPRRHSGFWVYFDEFPKSEGGGDGPDYEITLSVFPEWSGTSYGYFNDLCVLTVNNNGDLHIYPNRNWRVRDTRANPFNVGWIVNPGNKKYRIGTMETESWYWVEIWMDYSFPWDAKMRVAINQVECQGLYEGILNQIMGDVAAARYSGDVDPCFGSQNFGIATGNPNSSGQDQTYTGDIDMYLGPWFVGRGGTPAYLQRDGTQDILSPEPLEEPGIGAHAGGMTPFTRDGVHKILDIDDAEPFDLDGPEDFPLFEFQGLRFYKGSKSAEKSHNHDMSMGTSGYVERTGWAQPSLPPTVVSDGSGPVSGPYDYSGELALEIKHDPSGPGSEDQVVFGPGNWQYTYPGVRPPDGVREGGDPNDDGGNMLIWFGWARKVGNEVPNIVFDSFYEVVGNPCQGLQYWFSEGGWSRVWGSTYANIDYSQSSSAAGVWRWAFFDSLNDAFRMKHIRVFQNPHVYPRFKTSGDNGATSTWVEHPDDPVASFISDDPLIAEGKAVFLDNVCSFERFMRTAYNLPGLLGTAPTGISPGDYRHRRYVEVLPPTEPDLEDMNLQIAALRMMVRGAGYGNHGPFGDISTARANGTIKLRMVGGNHTIALNVPVTAVEKPYRTQVIPMTPMRYQWQTDRVAEIKIRMGFHFNYDDMGLNDSYGHQVNQAGGGVVNALACEVFCKVEPGPPICREGMSWKSRLTRRI